MKTCVLWDQFSPLSNLTPLENRVPNTQGQFCRLSVISQVTLMPVARLEVLLSPRGNYSVCASVFSYHFEYKTVNERKQLYGQNLQASCVLNMHEHKWVFLLQVGVVCQMR
jgi:hypothetical protein